MDHYYLDVLNIKMCSRTRTDVLDLYTFKPCYNFDINMFCILTIGISGLSLS